MIRLATMTTVFLSAASLAQADGIMPTGDAEAGEARFRSCIACHVVRDEAGEVLAGRNGRTGPNLYAIAGRPMGAEEDFRYSPLLQTAGEMGLIWTEEAFIGYLPNPSRYLAEATGERGRSTMAPQRLDEQAARDLYAYIASFAPLPEAEEEVAEAEE